MNASAMPPVQTQPNVSSKQDSASSADNALQSLDVLEARQRELQELEFDLANAPRLRSATITKASVLIPVHNERWTVETLIEKVLQAPLDLELEIVVVDDCSIDGSTEVLRKLAKNHEQIQLFCHEKNQGKGAAIRTAITNMTGDIAIIQDADLEYDPNDYPALLKPILDGRADAVYGSRFAGEERRVHRFWHSLINRCLTTFCNALNDLNLTDMETCYKVIRADILKELRLKANTFTLEPEITTRLAQWGARIFEVPIAYYPRKHCEGKKIKASDGIKAIASMLWNRFVDNRFTAHTGMYVLRSTEKAQRYNAWLIDQAKQHLGNRVVEAGAGIGNLSRLLTQREHLFLIDHDPIYVATLKDSLGNRGNVDVAECDLTQLEFKEEWRKHKLDTIFCANVLEHLSPDEDILRSFHESLEEDGKCIIVVPAEPKLYNGLDAALGHHRRYTRKGLEELMEKVGFEIAQSQQVCKIGALAWFFNGRILGRDELTPRQMMTFDRVWPLVNKFDRFLPWRGMSLMVVGHKQSS